MAETQESFSEEDVMLMYAADFAGRAAHPTFGRGTAQFEALVTFMAAVSVVLWLVVFTTIVVRLYLGHVWYRRRLRARNSDLLSP